MVFVIGVSVWSVAEASKFHLDGHPGLHLSKCRHYTTCADTNISFEKVVRRLMKQDALVVPQPKRRRYSSYLGEVGPAPESMTNRDFNAPAPDQKWLTAITEFHIRAGKVYLSLIIDGFDGLGISCAIGTKSNANLVNTLLDAAVETIAASETWPIIHSDRGGLYRWPGWLERIDAAKPVRSMSRKASSQDNAAC